MPNFILQLLANLEKYGPWPLLKVYVGSPNAPAWDTVMYQDFKLEVERVAAYWKKELTSAGVPQKSVVGLWLTGGHYTDLIHMYGLVRAGYVPQNFSVLFSFPGQAVVRDLLAACDGKAIIHDESFPVELFAVPAFVTPKFKEIPQDPTDLGDVIDVEDDDMAMVFHTSGTTGGRPKPVPSTHKWLNAQVDLVNAIWDGEDVPHSIINNIGSFAHLGSATSINYLTNIGACVIQTSKSDMDVEEFFALVEKGGMTRCLLYASWCSRLLEIAKRDPRMLAALKGMKQIVYTGSSLNPENERWIREQGIPVTLMYATTEIAVVMASKLADIALMPAMRIVPGANIELRPAADFDVADASQLDLDSQKRVGGGMLYEMFAPITYACCPHPMIRNRPDGHDTGDLFEEVAPGYYAFRGRSDDWIRTGRNHGFCDTKAIEDDVLLTCADIVQNCVVVGHYKPSIVLLVEPSPSSVAEAENVLKETIMTRTAKFRSSQFIHERLKDTAHIIVASPGSLPRTKEKGNIRRKGAEEHFAEQLRQIWDPEKLVQ